ncbi:MAG: hypothetical protein JXA46_12150 [Dehalococcoidales bacterium]|nr:hypothetical protein [Dehalococcoidales bacterium]
MSDRDAAAGPVTGKSPGDAYPVGSVVKIPIIPGYGPGPKIGDLLITLLEVLRGKEIENRLPPGEIPPAPEKDDMENVVFSLKVEYARYGRSPREQPYMLSDGQFLACSSDGDTEYQVIPLSDESRGGLIGYLFKAGDSRQNRLYCRLPVEEKKPYLLYRRENVENVWGLWSDIWFKLY